MNRGIKIARLVITNLLVFIVSLRRRTFVYNKVIGTSFRIRKIILNILVPKSLPRISSCSIFMHFRSIEYVILVSRNVPSVCASIFLHRLHKYIHIRLPLSIPLRPLHLRQRNKHHQKNQPRQHQNQNDFYNRKPPFLLRHFNILLKLT